MRPQLIDQAIVPESTTSGVTAVTLSPGALTVTQRGNSYSAQKSVLSCSGEFHYPNGCDETSCDYIAQWQYRPASDDILFQISSSRADEWTGIGFNDKGAMVNHCMFTSSGCDLSEFLY